MKTLNLEKNKKHSIEVVIDRIVVKEGVAARLADSLETALKLGEGRVLIDVIGQEELLFSEHHACPICGFSIDSLEPRMFSFNSPFGACPDCDGLGAKKSVDINLVIPDKRFNIESKCYCSMGTIRCLQYYPQLLSVYVLIMELIWISLLKISLNTIWIKYYMVRMRKKFYFRYENDFGQVRENYS